MGGSTLRVWLASPAFDSPAAEKVMGAGAAGGYSVAP